LSQMLLKHALYSPRQRLVITSHDRASDHIHLNYKTEVPLDSRDKLYSLPGCSAHNSAAPGARDPVRTYTF
jgi:hypothetical protein